MNEINITQRLTIVYGNNVEKEVIDCDMRDGNVSSTLAPELPLEGHVVRRKQEGEQCGLGSEPKRSRREA